MNPCIDLFIFEKQKKERSVAILSLLWSNHSSHYEGLGFVVLYVSLPFSFPECSYFPSPPSIKCREEGHVITYLAWSWSALKSLTPYLKLLLQSKDLLDVIVYDCKFVSTGAAVHFNRLKWSKQRKNKYNNSVHNGSAHMDTLKLYRFCGVITLEQLT